MKKEIYVMRKNKGFNITINVSDDEIANKSDEEIAEIIENKIRIEINKIMYGKRGF